MNEIREVVREEKLTIIGLILAIVLSFSIGYVYFFSEAEEEKSHPWAYGSCSQAASRCNTRRAVEPESPCLSCEEKCVSADGEPYFGEKNEPNVIDCCKLGLKDEIFVGAEEEGEYKHACDPEFAPDLVADFNYSTDNLEVQFNGNISKFDPYHPDREILEYEWDFGDGENSNEKKPIHEYDSQSEYDVELKIKDDRGETDSITKTIEW